MNWVTTGGAQKTERVVGEVVNAASQGKGGVNYNPYDISEEAQKLQELDKIDRQIRAADKAGDTVKSTELRNLKTKLMRGVNPLVVVAEEVVRDALKYKEEGDVMDKVNNARQSTGLSDLNPTNDVHRHTLVNLFKDNPQAALQDFNKKLKDTNKLRKEHGLPSSVWTPTR